MIERKLDVIKLIAQPYALNILSALKKPKRYKDLKSVCKNDRTLAKRIKVLKEMELIEPIALKEREKYTNFYRLTKNGYLVLAEIEKLKL